MIGAYPWLMVRLMAMVLLGAIGLQAVHSDVAPLERHHGSAFSASTAEVALLSPVREAAQAQASGNPAEPPPLALPWTIMGWGASVGAHVSNQRPNPLGYAEAGFIASLLAPRPPPTA